MNYETVVELLSNEASEFAPSDLFWGKERGLTVLFGLT